MTSSSPRAGSTRVSPASSSPTASRPNRARLKALDIVRTLALVAMAFFHFVVDLEIFGHLPPGTTQTGPWPYVARIIAGTFLFVSGVSLWLAQGNRIHWRPFLRRLALLALAAGGISLATYLAMPHAFIYFGILHSIAAASVIGLAFLRLPPWLTLAAAVFVLLLPRYFRSEAFDHPALWWTGLSPTNPPSIDFEPVFPWLAACLAGIAAAKLADSAGWLERLETRMAPSRLTDTLAWPGRHSLAIYLIHQPVLLATIWAAGLLL